MTTPDTLPPGMDVVNGGIGQPQSPPPQPPPLVEEQDIPLTPLAMIPDVGSGFVIVNGGVDGEVIPGVGGYHVPPQLLGFEDTSEYFYM